MSITRMISDKWDTVDGKYQKVADAYPETFAHGKVLKVETVSHQIMSDIWGSAKQALYWDDVDQRPKTCIIDICDYSWGYGDKVHAEVDATPEVYAALREYLYQQEYNRIIAVDEAKANEIHKGARVEVYKGRNGKGTVGPVVVEMIRPYRMGWQCAERTKFAVALDDEMVEVVRYGKTYQNHKNVVWVWEHNCRLLNVPVVDTEIIKERANASADRLLNSWYSYAAKSAGNRVAA